MFKANEIVQSVIHVEAMRSWVLVCGLHLCGCPASAFKYIFSQVEKQARLIRETDPNPGLFSGPSLTNISSAPLACQRLMHLPSILLNAQALRPPTCVGGIVG